ncbi:hypothetical protein GCM10011413_25540 [Pedobacter psychrotolerans]|uniref:Uncharacterized protein n=1 Tax=Pedobacter psychrotolerans TaxID=1843235 RepID=A0ABQ1SR85_9SPHI|nr:hypothetical protein GCM10011413_25540 [Pedobacter psychrotolerans]
MFLPHKKYKVRISAKVNLYYKTTNLIFHLNGLYGNFGKIMFLSHKKYKVYISAKVNLYYKTTNLIFSSNGLYG